MRQGAQRAKKKKIEKKLFSPYKIIDSENFIKVSQNPNKVARDTQGLPTVPHNDFGGLNFKGLASKYLLLMATSFHTKSLFLKKNHEKIFESPKRPRIRHYLGWCELKSGLLFDFAFLVFVLRLAK